MGKFMIRRCEKSECEVIHALINHSALAYKGVIPADCWKEPYMSREGLRNEIDEGVLFWGYEEDGELLGVMGIQDLHPVSLIRHAYVRTANQNQGIGGKLLCYLQQQTARPLLVGTWADAVWAIHFYKKHGFQQVSAAEKDRLLKQYWSISDRQVATSVVLVDQRWLDRDRSPLKSQTSGC